MNRLFIVLSASTLILTGCGSGQSLENEVKLVEYKACLESIGSYKGTLEWFNYKKQSFGQAIEYCQKYKP